MVSPGGDPVLGFFQVPPGDAESFLHAVALWFLHPMCGSGGPYPGHILSNQASFRLVGRVSLVRVRPIISHLH